MNKDVEKILQKRRLDVDKEKHLENIRRRGEKYVENDN